MTTASNSKLLPCLARLQCSPGGLPHIKAKSADPSVTLIRRKYTHLSIKSTRKHQCSGLTNSPPQQKIRQWKIFLQTVPEGDHPFPQGPILFDNDLIEICTKGSPLSKTTNQNHLANNTTLPPLSSCNSAKNTSPTYSPSVSLLTT